MWSSVSLVGFFYLFHTQTFVIVWPDFCPHSLGCDETSGNCSQETGFFFGNSTNVTNFAYGITANMAAVVLYGSTFVPVKRIETGDGEQKDTIWTPPTPYIMPKMFLKPVLISRHVLSFCELCIYMGCISSRRPLYANTEISSSCDVWRCSLVYRYFLLKAQFWANQISIFLCSCGAENGLKASNKCPVYCNLSNNGVLWGKMASFEFSQFPTKSLQDS